MTANRERRAANGMLAIGMPRAVRHSLFAVMLAVPLSAQAPGRYQETVSIEVLSRTATVEQSRSLRREAQYEVTRRGDTTVVQVLSATLRLGDGEGGVEVNTDGFVGGRWKLLPDATGALRAVDRPFIPPMLLEVSDLTTAMDDFFPPLPPRLAVGEKGRDAAGRQWQRTADSASVRRFHWEASRQRDTTTVVRDSLSLEVAEQIRETSALDLDTGGTPLGWRRELVTEVTSRVASRAVRATLRHHILVRRLP